MVLNRGDDRIRTGDKGVADRTPTRIFSNVFSALAGFRKTLSTLSPLYPNIALYICCLLLFTHRTLMFYYSIFPIKSVV